MHHGERPGRRCGLLGQRERGFGVVFEKRFCWRRNAREWAGDAREARTRVEQEETDVLPVHSRAYEQMLGARPNDFDLGCDVGIETEVGFVWRGGEDAVVELLEASSVILA